MLGCRGVSSTVRRCIEKETGREFAAKIIDVSADAEDGNEFTLLHASHREIAILRIVAGHPYISKSIESPQTVVTMVLTITSLIYIATSLCTQKLVYTVKLYDVFESSTYIFLVFEL